LKKSTSEVLKHIVKKQNYRSDTVVRIVIPVMQEAKIRRVAVLGRIRERKGKYGNMGMYVGERLG
jgi:dipeptidase